MGWTVRGSVEARPPERATTGMRPSRIRTRPSIFPSVPRRNALLTLWPRTRTERPLVDFTPPIASRALLPETRSARLESTEIVIGLAFFFAAIAVAGSIDTEPRTAIETVSHAR